jgi:ankyrin repeat protein
MGDPAPNMAAIGHNENHACMDSTGGMYKDATDLHYGLLSQQTRDGAYPLHIAIHSGASLPILELLIQQAPEVLTKTNKFGETPLHLALKKGSQNEPVVDFLLQSDTLATEARDDKGNLPIHNAAAFGCLPNVAKSLIKLRPEVIHEVNKEGLTPMACAIQHNRCNKEVLELLSIKDFRSVPPTDYM